MPGSIQILSTQLIGEQYTVYAASEGLELDCTPFIKIEPVQDSAVNEAISTLAKKEILAIFTSKNAVTIVSEKLTGLPSWKIACIQGETENAAAAVFGQNNILYSGNEAASLAKAIIASPNNMPVVFFAGNKRRDTLSLAFAEAGISLQEIILYNTVEIPSKINKQYEGILFMSPSAVKSFFSVNKVPPATVLFAIGNTTADAIKQYASNKIIISPGHSAKQLLGAVTEYFKK